jgi:hypothetical protein
VIPLFRGEAQMRGSDERPGSLFSVVDLEERVPKRHPLRKIREIANDALAALDGEVSKLYASEGRPSIAPEKLLRFVVAGILLCPLRAPAYGSARLQPAVPLVCRARRRLTGGATDSFYEERDRLLEAEVAVKFIAVLAHREVKPLLSNDHFSVDGTLVKAWASLKSFRAKDDSDQRPGRNGERDFHGEKRKNETHTSTTDPDAKLYRKSSITAAKLSYIAHALAENRHGLIVEDDATRTASLAGQ